MRSWAFISILSCIVSCLSALDKQDNEISLADPEFQLAVDKEDLSNWIQEGLFYDNTIEAVSLNEDDLISKRETRDCLLSKIETMSKEHFEDFTDTYLEGYIQALVDVHYYEMQVIVIVSGRKVTLYNLPHNELITKSITAFVRNLPEVKEVEIGKGPIKDAQVEQEEQHMVRKQINGIWFPQSTVLFQPIIADRREPMYSAEYRWGDEIMGKHVIAVSLGDTFPIFRWRNVFVWEGDLQIDVQACVWAIFDMGHNDNPNNEFAELVNTDYLIGFPLSYAIDKWSFRLRPYHISSHLGDEFLCNNVGYPRKNPSMEAIDFISSWQAKEGVRVYFGPGWVFHSDNTYPLKPFYLEYGLELRMFGHRSYYHRIYGTPYLAICVKNWQTHHYQFDGTYQLGYEWSKLQGVGRKVRVYVLYHHGFSEGQFFKDKANYWSAGFSYGF